VPTARFTKTDPERTLEPVMAADLIECSVEAIKDILTAIAQLDPISGHATDTLRESIEKRADWIREAAETIRYRGGKAAVKARQQEKGGSAL
jgi:hypothetical protein